MQTPDTVSHDKWLIRDCRWPCNPFCRLLQISTLKCAFLMFLGEGERYLTDCDSRKDMCKGFINETIYVREHILCFNEMPSFARDPPQGFINEAPHPSLPAGQTSRHRSKGDRLLWFFHLSLWDRFDAAQLHWRCSLKGGSGSNDFWAIPE